MFCLWTNDVESTSIWLNRLRYETGKKVLTEGMPRLLEIYSKYNIKSTFFFTGYMAQEFPEVVKMIIPYGHEVACHGFSHKLEDAFDILPLNKQIEHLHKAKTLLEDLSGLEVISFRAPALRVNKFTPIALNETGFKIDSSIASQRFDLFFSYGGIKKLKWLFSPRLPYKTAPDNLFKKGIGNIVEVPLSAFIFPFTSTTMRIFPGITRMQGRFIYFESKKNNKPIVFDIHPNEIIDESKEERIISRRAKNFISYFIKDYLRSKLKVKNLGENSIPIYESLIEYFQKKDYKMITLKEYCKDRGLV
ncbi:MAG: polysaccharide deacetylase family protein [Ignavibacteriae bacterium]|nr:polysaccharide deacetylase family protein [Ignavibacteriota bacterium]